MTDQPLLKFSVIIPCRNAGQWIEKTLASVRSQTLQPSEIIVVDDGSTDDSIQRIRNLSDSVRILHSEHRNGAGTRNVGIEAATGDWIAFLDADDIWYPDHLERASNLLLNSSDVGFVNWFDQFGNDSPDAIQTRPNGLDIVKATSGITDRRFFENYSRTFWFNMHGCVVRRDRLLEVGMLDPTQIRRHDIEMWCRVIHGKTWSYDPIPSSAYRSDTPGSISRNIANASYFLFRAFRKNLDLLPADIGPPLLSKLAVSAVSNALVHGDSDDVKVAFEQAIKHVPIGVRTLLTLGKISPRLFRNLIKAKRSLQR